MLLLSVSCVARLSLTTVGWLSAAVVLIVVCALTIGGAISGLAVVSSVTIDLVTTGCDKSAAIAVLVFTVLLAEFFFF